MAHESFSATLIAVSQAEEIKGFIRQIRPVTRRKCTPEEKFFIVLEGRRYQVLIRNLCRRKGIRHNVYYAWLKDIIEAGKERQPGIRFGMLPGLRWIVLRENERLEQLIAELSLMTLVLKNNNGCSGGVSKIVAFFCRPMIGQPQPERYSVAFTLRRDEEVLTC